MCLRGDSDDGGKDWTDRTMAGPGGGCVDSRYRRGVRDVHLGGRGQAAPAGGQLEQRLVPALRFCSDQLYAELGLCLLRRSRIVARRVCLSDVARTQQGAQKRGGTADRLMNVFTRWISGTAREDSGNIRKHLQRAGRRIFLVPRARRSYCEASPAVPPCSLLVAAPPKGKKTGVRRGGLPRRSVLRTYGRGFCDAASRQRGLRNNLAASIELESLLGERSPARFPGCHAPIDDPEPPSTRPSRLP